MTPLQVYRDGVLNIRNGRIVDVGSRKDVKPLKDAEVFSFKGKYVLPGFVDIHVHGAVGFDTMTASHEAFDKISNFYATHGTTSLLMTTISSPIEDLIKTVKKVKDTIAKGVSGSQIVGVHIEGPYYIYDQRGCHAPHFLQMPRIDEYTPLLEEGRDIIRMMSFSPELEGTIQLAETLKERGIVASMGHSNASYEQVLAAVKAGVAHCVHLYCAMGMVHQCRPEERPNAEFIPGTTEAVLDCDKLTAEIISDGVHVHPSLIRMAVKCKGLNKTVLVSDAMHAAGMGDGEYVFGGMEILVKNGVARTRDGILASSTKPLDYMLKQFCEYTGLSIIQGVQAATLNPSLVIGLDKKGRLEKGKDADFIIMDDNFIVYTTFVKGKKVYQRA